jgi:hypothetical protein
MVVPYIQRLASADSRSVNIYEGGTGILVLMTMAAGSRTRTSKLQHDVAHENCETQERAANDFTHRTAGVVIVTGVGGLGSGAGAGGGSRAGGMVGREGGSNDRGSGGDGTGGSAFLDLVIDASDERPQVGALHVVGEVELDDPRGRAREVLRRGEVIALSINDDGVPANVLKGESRKRDRAHALTCVVRNHWGERDRRIR